MPPEKINTYRERMENSLDNLIKILDRLDITKEERDEILGYVGDYAINLTQQWIET